MADHFYFIASVENCRAYVRLSGYPLVEVEPEASAEVATNITLWVLPHVSPLEVSLAKRPDDPASSVTFKARVVRAAHGVDPLKQPPVWELQWPPAGLGDIVPFYSVFEVATETESELPLRAESLDLSDALLQEAIDYARHLYDLFAAGDASRLTAEMAFRAEDVARTLSNPVTQALPRLESFCRLIMEPEDRPFAARPWDASALEHRLMYDRRVLRIRQGEFPLLLSQGMQGMDVCLSRIAGQWRCTR